MGMNVIHSNTLYLFHVVASSNMYRSKGTLCITKSILHVSRRVISQPLSLSLGRIVYGLCIHKIYHTAFVPPASTTTTNPPTPFSKIIRNKNNKQSHILWQHLLFILILNGYIIDIQTPNIYKQATLHCGTTLF